MSRFSQVNVFNRKSTTNPGKSQLKLFDSKRDISSRLKHLRLISDNYEVKKLKHFYHENFSYIYYLFHEGFTAAELVLSTKASRNPQREDMDLVLYTLEKILCVLPELINKRWQCHSLGQIMSKLLRCSAFQKDGMRLFIAWYSILMDNATENCDRIFRNLIPISDRGIDLMQNSGSLCFYLEWILKCLVTEAAKVMWSNQEASFEFLFRKFYQYYVLRIFPDFDATDIYCPSTDALPHHQNQLTGQTSQVTDAYLPLQEVIIRWVTEFMQSSRSGIPAEKISFGIVPEKVPKDKPDVISASAAGVISSPEGQKTYTENECAMVRSVFYMSRENVNIVLEILHQAILVSLRHSRIAKRVISVYKHWFQSRTKPAFMDEPNEPGTAKTLTDRGGPGLPLNGCQRQSSSSSSNQSVIEGTDVAVGQQRAFQVFVTQSMVVFIRDWKNLNQKLRELPTGLQILAEQVDLCKTTLGVYRYVAMNVYMTRHTWTHLLTALLRMTSYILDSTSPKQKMQSLAGELASTLLQTLIVTWIRANLNFGVSKDLWNQLLAVLSSLTDWPEVIQEWAQALEVLTAILANVVYNVDAKSLYDDQTKDQKRRFVKNKQSSKDGSEDGLKIESDVVNGEMKRPIHPPLRGHHSSVAPLQQRRQHLSPTGSKPLRLPPRHPPQQPVPGLLMLRIPPHTASASVYAHDGSHQLIRSASETNLLSPSSSPKERVHSEGHMIRLKSLESLDVDRETDPDHLWTLKKQQLTIADSNVTLRHMEETATLTRSPNSSSARADSSYADDDVQSRSSTLERVSESDNNPLYHLQPPVHTSSPTTEDSLSGNGTCVGQNGNRTNGTCPAAQDGSDSDSRKPCLVNMSSLSSILEDRASITSTESFNSDWYPSGTSEMTPDSSVAGATAYDSPSLSSSSADKNLHSSTDSPNMSGGSPGFYKAGSHPLRLSEDLSSVFLESESDAQVDDLNEDGGVACLSSKHGTWTPEVAELMWRRVLGLLGDVNSIEDAESHATVFDCLRITTETLLKVHNNMTLQRVNQKTPPVLVIAPWVFQALTLPNKYLKGKVLAYRLLCLTMLQPYIDVPMKHLLRFYLVLHRGLVHSSNDVVNVLIKHCASQFFLMPLDGATILLLDFIHAATGIITVYAGQTQAPTFEAMSLLGSLICFPNHFGKMSVLTPDIQEVSMTSVNDIYVKDCIINVLLSNSACRETSQLTSCVRVCALGIYVYEELSHGTMHSKIRDAIEAILDSVKESPDQAVKLTSLDMLSLLTDHSQLLLSEFPDLPRVIIEALVSFVEHCLLSAKKASQTVNLKVLTNTLFCILTWVMSVPVALLLSVCMSPRSPNNCLLNRIFNVLQIENIPQGVDHNSNYQTLPANVRQSAEQASSAQLSKYDDKIASSESDLLMQDKPTKTSHVKEPGSALAPVVKAVRMHLLNYLGHYPMGQNGTSKLDSSVLECHDISNNDCLGVDILNRPDVQFLVWNECLLISLNELPSDELVDDAGFSSGLVTRNCRVIIRDMSGKHCYDLTSLFPGSVQRSAFESDVCLTSAGGHDCHPDIISSSSSSRGSLDNTSIPVKSIDLVDAILEEISRTSPECRLYDGDFLNCIFPLPKNFPLKIDDMMLDCIEEQRNSEDDYLSSATEYNARCKAEPLTPGHLELESNWPFQACRQFMSRMGYLASEHRNQIDLLRKSEQMIRDIRHLDTLICRETHKVAVIYVGGGQEDKASILSNEHGSEAYEEFITGLGWKVSLELHEGYMGGLQRNKTNGEMAIYFSTSTTEMIFHVSTIMPSSADSDDHQKKVRHLGNDEVHIVWSDHHRRYHRNILNTEFADVIIVIYPLQSGLFHIQILKKPEVSFFGPLFDGAIVDSVVLPSLVQATALNASRTIRAKKQHYQPFYEERDSCLKNIVSKHSELATREDFVSEIFLPGLRHSTTSLLPLNTGNQKAMEFMAQSHLRQPRAVRGKKPKKPT